MLDWERSWERKPATAAQRDQKIAHARWLWNETLPARNTPVDAYLWSRLLLIDPPPALRLHWGMSHRQSGLKHPAMVARVDHAAHGLVAVHATYLANDRPGGSWVCVGRNTFGPRGGGAVRLGKVEPDRWLVLGEGIETTLSMMIACGRPGWACLADNGLAAVVLPPEATRVLIAADHDKAGFSAAERLARRLVREGRRVRIAYPPVPNTDWNDALMGRAPSIPGDTP